MEGLVLTVQNKQEEEKFPLTVTNEQDGEVPSLTCY